MFAGGVWKVSRQGPTRARRCGITLLVAAATAETAIAILFRDLVSPLGEVKARLSFFIS